VQILQKELSNPRPTNSSSQHQDGTFKSILRPFPFFIPKVPDFPSYHLQPNFSLNSSHHSTLLSQFLHHLHTSSSTTALFSANTTALEGTNCSDDSSGVPKRFS
jgi:hypothetical protein